MKRIKEHYVANQCRTDYYLTNNRDKVESLIKDISCKSWYTGTKMWAYDLNLLENDGSEMIQPGVWCGPLNCLIKADIMKMIKINDDMNFTPNPPKWNLNI